MLKPVLFGEKIKVEGPRASSAGAQLVAEAEGRGESALVASPDVAGKNTIVLTRQDADTYDEIMTRARKAAIPKIFTCLPAEIKSSIQGQHKNADADSPQYGFFMRFAKRLSNAVIAVVRPELDALFDAPRIVQDTAVLGAREATVIDEALINTTGVVTEVNTEQFDAILQQSPVPVLLDFTAPWCNPCKQLIEPLENLAAEYEGRLKIVKVNVDENEELYKRFNLMGVPALLLFRDGEAVGKPIMGPSPSSLKKELEKRLS